MTTAGISHHQTHAPVPIGSIVGGTAGCLTLALIRIQSIRRKRGCGSWVFVSPDGTLYVLSDEATALPGMQRENASWLVGYFRDADRGRGPRPDLTLADLTEAIAAHMAGCAPLMPGAAHAA